MTLQQKLKRLGDCLAETVPNTFHYFRPMMDAPFCVWAEDGGGGFCADDRSVEQSASGTVDYFTRTEYDPAFDGIQVALDSLGICWELNSVQFEPDTNLIHYEWIWELA